MDKITSLPVIENPSSPLYGKLQPRFWRYYLPPFGQGFFFDPRDPFNDLITIIWGPRGGGKSTTGVTLSIVDGQMKGIPTISNIPIRWVAKDAYGAKYTVESIPFNVEQFESGDPALKFKRLLLDEGNYLADRLRSTSNNNMGITDILQQARKFRMCVTFCTINWQWIDPRVTGSLCDIVIECNDLYYKPYGKKHGLKKGERITWDILDQSGKITGRQNSHIDSRTFNARLFWDTFDTEHFVDPREARKKRHGYNDAEKMLPGVDGELMPEGEWLASVKARVSALAQAQSRWKSKDLFDSLGLEEHGLRLRAGRLLRRIPGVYVNDSRNGPIYNFTKMEPAVV